MQTEVSLDVFSDSSAAISSQSRVGLGRLKHVHLKHMFVQGHVKEDRLQLRKIGTADNSSDLGTKHLDQEASEKHRLAAGLVDQIGAGSIGTITSGGGGRCEGRWSLRHGDRDQALLGRSAGASVYHQRGDDRDRSTRNLAAHRLESRLST